MKTEEKFNFDLIRHITHKDSDLIRVIYSDLQTRAFGFGRKVDLEYAVNFFTPVDSNPNHYLFFKDNLFIGRAVLKLPNEGTTALFGIAVNPQIQGKGHGTNIANYILKKAFDNPSIDQVSGTTLKFNIPSQKLMQKLGMNPNGIQEKKLEHQDYDTYSLVFSISKETFLQKSSVPGKTHPDSIPFDDLIYEDYQSTYSEEKYPNQALIISKRKDLYIKLQLSDPKKVVSFYTGITCLTATEMLENSALYSYILDEILYPLHHQEYLSKSITDHLPTSNTFWVSSHFILSSFSFVMLQHFNPSFSQTHKFIVPLFSTAGYATNLFIHDYHKTLAEDRLFALHNTSTVDDSNFLEHCLPEIALTTTSSFIFSLPTAISFSPLGVSYSAFTTLSAAASSTINCAYNNKKFVAPNNDHISAKVLPYVADALIAAFLINKFSTPSFYFLPDAAITLKKASFFFGALVNVDQISKAIIELTPDSVFEYLDSFFSFNNVTELHTPEL